MENKSNSLSRIKRQQREKVLRFSIRKYSFGAASVAVAALMFLGARVASADSLVDKTSQLNAGVVNPKNEAELPKESPDTTEEKVDAENQALTSTVNNAPTVDKAKLKKVVEELNVLLSTKLNLDESVVSPVKDRLQKGKEALESSELAQKDIDELVELLSKDVTVLSAAAKESTEIQGNKTEKQADNLASQTSPEVSASEENQTVSAKKDALKVSVDQLQAAVLELPEHETSKEVLEKANELLGLAQGVLENTTVSLNDVEDMTKRVKRMFNSVKNATTRLTSGSRDSRNGQSMGEGAQFRATTVEYGRVENALINVKEYISEAKGQGTTTIGNRDRTISKTFMTAKYSEENGKKFITYDVYFQNDGKALDGVTNNTFWFYPPRDILYGSGEYPVGTIYEAYYERYRNDAGTGTLSQNPNNFTKVGNTYNIPLKKYVYQDSGARQSWNDRNLLYQLDGGPARNSQRQEMLKNLEGNSELNSIIKSNGSYPGASYSHILTISSHQNYAYKYHVKMRLRDNVTTTEAQKAGTMAVTTKAGSATNATAAYVYAGLGTRLVSQPDAPLDPIQGLTVTKTVGDPLKDPDDPVNSGYVKHKNGKSFPAGMTWSWQGNVKPTSTAKAGVFKYKVIARYQDGTSSEDKGSGSDGTVTLNVKPKQPTITTNVANKKGLPNQQITVNVGSGVPDGSTVNIYDGDTVIGTGTTKGETATVTVKGALPGKPITAKTVVTNNNGTVTSDKSKPVTPTEVPDNQKPQATLNGITLTETANTPIFTVYRGAEFNPELKVWDNSGKISKVTVGNLPSGVSASNFTAQTGKDGSSEDKKYKTRLSSGIVDTQTLGEYTATLHVEGSSATDSRDLKFKYRVVDIESKNLENGVAKVPVGSTLNVPNSRTNVDAHNYLKVVDSKDKADRGNSHLPQGMTWTWKSGDKLDPGTTLDNSGKYTRNATAQFPSSVTDNNSTTRTTFAPTEIKRPVVLAVTPTAPSVVANENGSVTVTPPTRPNGTTPQDIDTITLTYTPTGKTTPETVTVAKSGNNWTVNGKTTDKVSVTPAGVVTISDLEVADGKEVTAKVSKRIDNNVVLESPVAKVTSKSSKPAKPVAVAKDNGDVTGKPQDPAKADKITVSYTGEDNQPKTAVGKKDPKGKWTVNTPEVQINPNTGEITIPENKVKDGTEVTVVTKNGDGADSDPAKATAKFSKPAKPVATAKDNGDVTGKPQNPAKADKITVSYTGEDNQPKTAVGTKDPKGNWTVNTPEVQINPKTGEITIPDNKVKDGTEVTVVTKNGNSTDSDPAKAVAKDAIKPEATLNGVRLTENANSPIFTVYRGATFNPELKVWDNSGVISKVEVKGGLPKGVTASTFTSQTGKTEANPYATRLSSGTVLNTETLGEHEATLHVEGSSTTDSRDLKFKYRVVDIETRNLENGIAKVPVASTLNVANSGKNIDAHRYLKVVDSEDKADRGNNYLPSGMTWTWKAGDKLDSGTTLDNSGKYTRNATAVFPNASKNSITDVNSTTRTTFAPAEIKRQVVLAVTPTVPSVVGHENGSVTITPPTRPNSTNPQDIDTITLTYVPTGKTTPETVTVTKSGNTWTVNGKTADKVSVTPAGVVTISDAEVADKTEITAKVSKRIDNVVLESPVARGTANGSLGAEVTPPAPVLEKEKTTPVTVVTPNKPGSTITTETPVNGLTVDGDGNLTGTPTVTDWGPKEEERKVTIPVKVKHGDEVVPVNVPVTIQRDTDGDGIPDKVDTDDDNDGIPDKDEEKNGTDPKTPTTQTPTIDITRKPNGDAVVTPKKPDGSTYPPGTKVEIPGEDGTPITVTIGDNGSGEVPNDKLPKGDLPGKGTVTEPNKNPSKPVEVTTPARKTPTVELEQDPDTGEVTVTPKKPDGTTYPPGTKVEIPGKDGNPITVTIGEDGKGKVPNSELPEGKVPGTSKITVPGKPSVDVPNVTTPSKLIPTVELEQDPDTGEVTVTPKKPDGTTYPPGTKVEIPGKDGNPITVTIGEDGKGKVPNSELPEGKVPGTSKITVPGKPSVEVPNVTTPSKLIPTVELEQDPDTGEVTVTPKKPDGTTYPPGTKVEIPGKDGNPITVTIGEDGKGKVPNSELPEGKVSGTSKITVPGKPSVEVPNVTTPSKLIPTVELEQDPDTGEVTVTPKKPDGTTYPPGTKVEIPGKDGNPITVTIGEDGKGKVPNSELPEGKVPGTSKITVPGKPSVEVPNVTTPSKLIPTVELEQDPDTGEVTVTPKKPDGTTYPPGTKVEIPGKDGNPITVTIGEDGKGKVPNSELPEGKVSGTSKITVPGKPSVEVPNVTTPSKLIPTVELEQDPDTGEVTVTPKKPDGTTYPPGTKVEIPGKDGNPITVTIGEDGKGKVPNSELPEGKVPGTSKITVPGKPSVDVPNVTTPSKIIPGAPTTEQPVEIEITRKPNGDAVVTPKKPGGSTYPPGTKVEIPGEDKDGNPITITVTIDDNGSGEVPNDNLPKKDVPGTGTVTEPKKNPSQPVKVTTPARKTPTLDVEQDPKTGDVTVTPKKPDGSKFSSGTKVEIPGKDKDHPITVTIGEDGKGKVPNSELPEGKTPGTGKITEPGKPTEEVPNVTTPSKVTPTLDVEQDPDTGEVTVTPKKPDGSTYPPGTTVEIPGKDGKPITVTIGEDGKGKVPNSDLPDVETPGTGKITEPGKPTVEVPNVTTPSKVTPTLDVERDPETGDVTVTPKKPDGSTYPPGTTVEIPGKDGKPITVTIGEDGKGKVPNSDLPDVETPGTGKITEPGKPTVEVPNVTTPSKVTPTLDVERDPETGDVTVTPKKPDGSTYPPGTTVEIPGKDGKPITVTIGEDGKGKVPNSDLPDVETPGTGKITEPGKPAVEVPNVTTPAKFTPETPVTEQPGKIEITQQPNGNAIVTPKKPDGTTYPSGSKVEIPGENGTTITVTIGDNGSGEVPNDKLPKGDLPGKGTVTEPNKKPSQPVDVTTPARKTPTLDVERDPETGDVTVTPKKPDGSTYPPGTTVEIPGKDGKPITVTIGEDGKGKVPNSDLPDVETPGTGKITEPGKPAVEVPNVTTPAKVTPATPVTEKPGKIEITQQPNGNAIVTPKKPDGTTYPSGSKVEIPGENGTTITVTIGDNGSGEVPNDKLPKGNVPGTGTVTEPNKKPSQPVDVTTPARKTPTLDVKRVPETGDVIVTPKKPDGTTYPPGTTVEIPGKDGKPITVTIGEDGKGKVPNSDLPDVETPGTGKITEPGKPAVEVPNVTTPAKFTPETPVTEKPGKIEITRKPNGNAIVTPKKPDGSTYPPGTKVEIPGENGTTITVTIGDNGSGEVPNDKLPKGNVPGTGTVTEPNKKPSQPVDVTTPARKTPTLDVKRVPETGDVIVTPKKPDGSTFPPGTMVEIPGENGPITVTIGKDGSGKVPNDNLPKKDVPGTGKITEPGKPAVEVPNVTTPAKVTPETPVTEKPGKIEITRKPNGNAIVTPKKPDGTTYPSGSKVEIPGENGTTITVTIGDNGSGEVPNDKLPKGNVPGTGTVTEPNKKPSQPVDVTTPARKTPTVELEQDPKTGDVTVTPKKPDGSTYPPGTKVEIPGKDGNSIIVTIGEDGKGKVPNSELPEGKVPGTAKITEPGQPTVEVPDVTTPGKVTPSTGTNPVAPVTPDMPVKPDTNGDSGQDKPAPATPTPNTVAPNADQVDAKTTVDNGAKSNDSQNVLPNTGTESNAALASLGLLGLLSGFGLVARKKNED